MSWVWVVIGVVGLAIFNFVLWAKRNQNVKDWEGKIVIEWRRINGYDQFELREVGSSRFIEPPAGHKMDKGTQYEIDEGAMTSIMWPPDGGKSQQIMLRKLSFYEGISKPIKRKDATADNTPLPEQLRFARNMAYMEWTARFGKNMEDLINAILHPKQPTVLYILMGVSIMTSAAAAYMAWQASQAVSSW